jgi:5-dehydro-2-deoxygluconokinase
MSESMLDVVTIGRSSVDLYGQQIGTRLEDMASFSKAVGGCPANIAIGTSRLGLRSGVITRVGDEHFGRFIREQLTREGVDVAGVRTDPDRLTALAILGVRDSQNFPLIFYRSDCADAALDESDIDPALIARTRAIVVTGTHFARPHSASAQRKAMALVRAQGGRVIFDVDYRPNLWGLSGHGDGENRYIRADSVTARLAGILPDCDLIVGTEEELHIAGGSEDTLQTIRAIRALSPHATIVAKRGPMGCVVFPGDIPDSIEDGIKGPGFPVEVYNTLGAGDAFLSGFLRGWLRDAPLETCCAFANACGAFAVSRLLCSTEIPTFLELRHFLSHGSAHRGLRHDAALNHLHWATTRRAQATPIMALACDHRLQLEAVADSVGAPYDKISPFKVLAVRAAARVAAGRPGFGMFLDGRYGREALFAASHAGLWLARSGGTHRIAASGVRGRCRRAGAGQPRHGPGRMAERAGDQVSLLLPSRRRRGAAPAPGARAATGSGCLPAAGARAADRDHRRQARDAAGGHHRARADQALCDRPQAGLVEAGTAARRRVVAADGAGDRGQRSAVPRHRDAGAGGA